MLQFAARVRATAAFDVGVTVEQVLSTVLPCLSPPRLDQLVQESTELYLADRLGGEN
jgi:hypothetical protein